MSAAPRHVVATAGHVDHGKSSLILRLTGIDPDRWAEEKRRGLTIDLGFAWGTLPSGTEIGFVDVPGHERFIRNMLAGVGPLREVVFVVAADEGWSRQSTEHLEILDVLGARGVIALTKADLVDADTVALARAEVHERIAGTVLEPAPLVVCSAVTGAGIDELRAALDGLVRTPAGPPQASDRPRLHVDRVFTITGAGTVVTGTSSGGTLTVGDEVELLPSGRIARIRSLQSHERAIERAEPVSRVAVNLVGIDREQIERGVVLTRPGTFVASDRIDVRLTPVRSLAHPVTARGAFKVYAGSAELDATVRLLGTTRLDPGGSALARLHLSRPHPFDPSDRIVLREAGRRETVAGGRVLDVQPITARTAVTIDRLRRRERVAASELPGVLATERGAIPVGSALLLSGGASPDPGAIVGGSWLVDPALLEHVRTRVLDALARLHAEQPLREGADLPQVRTWVEGAIAEHDGPEEDALRETLLDDLAAHGDVVRTATTVRLASHTVKLDEGDSRLAGLLDAVGRHPERPPTVAELVAGGVPKELIDAAAERGRIVRVSGELVFVPAFVEEAIRVARDATDGLTVAGFRERLGTSRKYAVPLLEHLDRIGVTRRAGDLRFPR